MYLAGSHPVTLPDQPVNFIRDILLLVEGVQSDGLVEVGFLAVQLLNNNAVVDAGDSSSKGTVLPIFKETLYHGQLGFRTRLDFCFTDEVSVPSLILKDLLDFVENVGRASKTT